MAQTYFEIVGVVRRRYFYAARAELHISVFIPHYGNSLIYHGQNYVFTY